MPSAPRHAVRRRNDRPRRKRRYVRRGVRRLRRQRARRQGRGSIAPREFRPSAVKVWTGKGRHRSETMTDPDRPLVVITGAAGNIGTSLTEALKARYKIVGLDRGAAKAADDSIEIDFTADDS